MSVAIITGAAGLVGSEAARMFHDKGLDIVGIDNNMRKYFFGDDGSVGWNATRLKEDLRRFRLLTMDIRDEEAVFRCFADMGKDLAVVVHCAAQPSHDWAAREPLTDFTINANGTLVLLEAVREHCPDAPFIFMSTNKVYGDTPNRLPLIELGTRWEVDPSHPLAKHGIDETLSIDHSLHSLFGVSKAAADLVVQEYGRYFGLKTVAFRGGCIAGSAHSGAELHGFLSYLVKCAIAHRHYTIYGYKGKQVRDNLHAKDLAAAFWQFLESPRCGAVYNIGGSRHSCGSVIESINLIQELSGYELDYRIVNEPRSGDHIWYVSDVRKFQSDYPDWKYTYDLKDLIQETLELTEEKGG